MFYENKFNLKKDIYNYLDKIDKCLVEIKSIVSENCVMSYSLIEIIKNNMDYLKDRIEDLDDSFLLFVMGPGKNGKSTLINAMLKKDYTKTSTLPITWKIDSFIKSDKEGIIIVDKNFTEQFMPFYEANKILKEEEVKRKESEKSINEKILQLKKSTNMDISELKKYKEKLKSENLYIPNIVESKYLLNINGIIDDFIIIDTPGLNQVLLGNTKKRMEEYYKKADGILWIIDAQNIASKTCFEMIDNIQSEFGFSKKSRIIGLINKADIIVENYGLEKLNEIIDKVNQIYKNIFVDVVPISAKLGYEGGVSQNKEMIKQSNIENLYKSIDEHFKRYSEQIQIQSKLTNLNQFKQNVINEINIYKRKLYEDIFENETKKRNIKNEINKTKTNVEEKLNKFINKYKFNFSINFIEYKVQIKKLERHIDDEIYNLKNNLMNIVDTETLVFEYNNLNIINNKLLKIEAESVNNTSEFIEKRFLSLLNLEIDKIYRITCQDVDEKYLSQYVDLTILDEYIEKLQQLIKNINLGLGDSVWEA